MNAEGIRESVSRAYAKAISKTVPSCCASANSCSCRESKKSTLADMAGYNASEIASHPEVAASSFGCGNPLAFSEVKEGDVVLDLGSGAGFDLLIASEKVMPNGRVIGIDMTDEMIKKAEENIRAAGAENIDVRKGVIENMPVSDNSVDWVISNCVINLSPEKEKVFSEIFRVLKPGGRMLVSDIVAEELPKEIKKIKHLYNSCVSGAKSEQEYVSGLRKAGLVNIEILDRLVYETIHIRSILDSDQTGIAELFGKLSGEEKETVIDSLVNQTAGKIWSAKFSARKPDPDENSHISNSQ